MKLTDACVLLTGASGGIGAAIAREVVQAGGKVLLTGRDESALRMLARALDPAGARVGVHVADLTRPVERRQLAEAAAAWQGGVNVLVNNAGTAGFGAFEALRPEALEQAFQVNVIAPMQLCRLLLPRLMRQPAAHIVNVGSVFGTIGYPGQVAYSATKFALRGFSEALRRELLGTSVHVHYLAPRATRTRFNSAAVDAMNDALGVATDPPERVASSLRRMLESGAARAVIGWPEKLFARINALLPDVVDRSIARQLPIIRGCLADHAPATETIETLSRKAS